MRIGYIGLGKMGKNMVLRLLEQGIEVVAWNRSPEPLNEVVKVGAIKATGLEDLVRKLHSEGVESGRIIWLMLPSGEVTEQFISELSTLLSSNDLIIDGGNSYYKDTQRRFKTLKQKGIHFMDVGTSGGPGGARTGACLMVGGEKEDVQRVAPLLKAVAAPSAYAHLGEVGAGHFAKMVHNGIEYGMMESIAEGAAILKKSNFNFDLAQVFDLYNHRSVVESRLVGWAFEAFKKDPELNEISSEIKSTGEGEWAIKTAGEIGIDIPVIEGSFKVRQNSKNNDENAANGFRNKVVSALRGKFGGHEVKKLV